MVWLALITLFYIFTYAWGFPALLQQDGHTLRRKTSLGRVILGNLILIGSAVLLMWAVAPFWATWLLLAWYVFNAVTATVEVTKTGYLSTNIKINIVGAVVASSALIGMWVYLL